MLFGKSKGKAICNAKKYDKGLRSQIYKETLRINKKEANKLTPLKNGKRLEDTLQ